MSTTAEAPTNQSAVDPERVQGEVVDGPPADSRQDAARAAVDAIADLALQTPGLPGRDEFMTLAMVARTLSLSPGVKKGYQHNPHLCLQAVLIGRELGIGPTTALEMIDPIPAGGGGDDDGGGTGRGQRERTYRLTLSPKLLNARLAQLGIGRIQPVVTTAARVELDCLDRRGQPLGPTVIFTWQDAQAAGMAGKDCQPSADGQQIVHSKPWPGKGRPACGCKSTWIQYPKRMMFHRATGYAADDYFPGARLGLYSPDELGALTDGDGAAIDPAIAELPPGYESTAPGGGDRGPDPTMAPADPTLIHDLYLRVSVLPDDDKATLRDRWNQSRLAGINLGDLVVADLKLAGALISTMEGDARKRGVDIDGALEAARTAELPTPPGAPTSPAVEGEGPPALEGEGGWDPDDAGRPFEDPPTAAETPTEGDQQTEGAERHIQGMSEPEVDGQLTARGLATDGSSKVRRARLAMALHGETER